MHDTPRGDDEDEGRLFGNEAAIARALIRAAGGPHEMELLAQIDAARVITRTGTWIDLAVGDSAPAAPDGPLPIRGVVVDDAGRATGFILLWLTGWELRAMEHAWVTDEVPTTFPDPSRVTAVPDPSSDIQRR